jgi:hypothetical protein
VEFAGVAFDGMAFDGMAFDGMALDGMALDGMAFYKDGVGGVVSFKLRDTIVIRTSKSIYTHSLLYLLA